MTVSTARALEEVARIAAELGLACEPIVLADRSNLVLHLAPHPIVARIAMATSLVRTGMAWLRREVEIARYLDARGVAVTRPSTVVPPGPFERAGHVISFWQLEAIVGDRAEPHAAGAALASAHRHLREYPRESLPEWGNIEEARAAFARARAGSSFAPTVLRRVEAAWDDALRIVESARVRTASFQAVHGDAHVGNVLGTARGPVWTDWEDAFVGPIEWDLASLRSKAELFGEDAATIDAMTAAYDEEHDPELVRDLGLVRNVQVVSWLAVFAERHPELLTRMHARIDRLPRAP